MEFEDKLIGIQKIIGIDHQNILYMWETAVNAVRKGIVRYSNLLVSISREHMCVVSRKFLNIWNIFYLKHNFKMNLSPKNTIHWDFMLYNKMKSKSTHTVKQHAHVAKQIRAVTRLLFTRVSARALRRCGKCDGCSGPSIGDSLDSGWGLGRYVETV